MDFAVVRLSSFGDVVLTEPVTRGLKAGFPGARIWFITRAEYAQVPALFEAVDEVIPYKRQGANEEISRLGGTVTFEAVIDLQNNMRSRALCRDLKKARLVRYSRPVLKRFLLVKMPWLYRADLRHTIDLYGDALGRLGASLVDRVPRVKVGEGALDEALKSPGPAPAAATRVALCPGGSSDYKRWPESHFAGLADLLAASGREVVILGSEEDRRVVEIVAARADSSPAVVVTPNVSRLAASLSKAAVTVTNDSGLMHLAAAAGSRVVAIFGPTSPALGFAPLGEGHIVAGLGLSCGPCSYHGNRPCRLKRRVCMEDLMPAEVLGAVETALEEGGRHA